MVGTTLLHGEFLRHEKIELIDQQVRETATALLDSELGGLRKVEFERVESILSEELGENRIGKFFVIRNNAGDILFVSSGAKLLPISELPRSPRWITIEQKRKYIRLLNLDLPKIPDRTLQVGIVVNQELLSPGYFSRANLFFTGAIMLVGLLLASFLTATLVKPMSSLAGFISLAARNPDPKMQLPPLPRDLKALAERPGPRDELADLLFGFESLIERVNRDYRMSRIWSYQMAHELKTPMALIEAKVTEGQRLGIIGDGIAKEILHEVFETSETITSFLTWAELENSRGQKRLFVVKASKPIREMEQRLKHGLGGRLEIQITEDFDVLTNIQHLEHALGNLVLNALTHSQGTVTVRASDHTIQVRDLGGGLPSGVVERIGEPFNKGAHSGAKGHGLGLALVQSICRIYEWKLTVETSSMGSVISIRFPGVVEEKSAGPA